MSVWHLVGIFLLYPKWQNHYRLIQSKGTRQSCFYTSVIHLQEYYSIHENRISMKNYFLNAKIAKLLTHHFRHQNPKTWIRGINTQISADLNIFPTESLSLFNFKKFFSSIKMSTWKYHLLEGISFDSVLRNYLHPIYIAVTLSCRIISQQELTG